MCAILQWQIEKQAMLDISQSLFAVEKVFSSSRVVYLDIVKIWLTARPLHKSKFLESAKITTQSVDSNKTLGMLCQMQCYELTYQLTYSTYWLLKWLLYYNKTITTLLLDGQYFITWMVGNQIMRKYLIHPLDSTNYRYLVPPVLLWTAIALWVNRAFYYEAW